MVKLNSRIYVVNKKKSRNIGHRIEDIYIGRPSVLGNPFKIGPDGSRDDVIEKYRHWLWVHIQSTDNVYNKLMQIVKLINSGKHTYLICWCAPLPCHGDVIKKAIEWLYSKSY